MRLTTKTHRQAAATLIACLLSSTALAQSAGPDVSNVDLGQSGVALYTLTQSNPGGDVSITVPRDHADDVLASLIVRDPVGRVIGISTATPADLPESLRGTPFAGGLPSGITALLQAMTGKSVTVRTATEEVTGIVLGLSERQEVQGEAKITHPAVLLQQESGALTELILRPGASVAIDPELGDPLRAAAGTINTGEAVKTFDLELEGDAPRDIELSYVTEAPAWKNSWRLLLEEGRLQGWAAVENVSGQDWTGIDLTLSTGSPVAYSRDLLTPLRIGRLDPPNLIAGRPTVRLDTGFAAPAPRQRGGVMLSGSAEMGLFSGADMAVEEAEPIAMAPPARAATELRGIGNVRYAVPEPVDLEAGRTANLLYIDLEIDPQIRALYQPGQSDQILLAVELTADQALAPGLVSVRDANGFVGDAPFAGLATGQTRFLPYASAPNATVVRDEADTGARIDFRVVDGLLQVEIRTQRQTRYTATVPDGVEIFAVEHPKTGGRFIEANGDYEENAGFIRVSREVGEAGSADISITEENRVLQQFSLDSNGLRNALSVTNIGSAELEEADREVLTEARAIIATIEQAQQRLTDLTADYQRLTDEQDRLRSNLRAVELAELRRRYETGLIETEDEIATRLDALETARTQLREAEAQLEEVLRGFS